MSNEQMAVKWALRELVDAYALAVDTRDAKYFGRLFTATGSLEIHEPGVEQAVLTYTSTAEIESVVELVMRFSSTFHVMTNHISVLGEKGCATGTTYCLAHHLSKDETQDTLMLIRYEDDYVFDNEAWRFERRKVMRQWNDTLAADRSPLK